MANNTSLYTYVASPNVASNNFTTLYNGVQTVGVNTNYGNANVQAFLNAGSDINGNIVQNIVADGNINANGSLTIHGITNLGNVSNVHITGGNLNYVLQTDGNGDLNWVPLTNLVGNTTEYISFSVSSTSNNQSFTNSNLSSYANSNVMSVFKNGVNIHPDQYSISGNVLTINILLNSGDNIDVLPSGAGSGGSSPGGNLTEVQYNGGITLSGNSNFTYDQPNATLRVTTISSNSSYANSIYVNQRANLGNVGNVHITGGINGYVLKTDGTGNLSWVQQGNTTAGGSNTQIQYNNSGIFAGSANLTFNNTTNTLSVTNIISNGSQLSNLTAANIVGTVANANYATVAGSATTANSATTAGFAVDSDNANTSITVTGNSQPNITSVGQLTSLASNGVVNFTNASNVSLGTYSNLHIDGGSSGQVLRTDGNGNLSWTSFSSTTITNGNSNVNVVANANINISSNGVSNVFVVTNQGINVTGTSNIGNLAIANYFLGSGNLLGNIQGANIAGQVSNALIAGTVYSNAQPNITSVGTLTSLTVAGMTSIQEAKEKFVPNATGATGTVNFDVLTSAIILQTANASANFTLNIRGNSSNTFNSIVNNNESVSITYINKNGTTGYYANVIQIDSSNITPVWINGSAPSSGTISGYDVYNFNILKTNTSTYVVFGAIGGYK